LKVEEIDETFEREKKMNIRADEVKELTRGLGADLCGIASVERFSKAPAGFRPSDIYSEAKSVLVIAKRLPEAAFCSENPVPYTFTLNAVAQEVLHLMVRVSIALQEHGVAAVPVPGEPYEYWDEEKREGKGILSLRHAGYLAGLGVLGKNNLLMNYRYGNRITLGSLLLNVYLEPDSIAEYIGCVEKCDACINHCPVKALDGQTVNQKLCREKSQLTTKKGYFLYACHQCRSICPNGAGIS
jgi:epoxyqueuosine reductase